MKENHYDKKSYYEKIPYAPFVRLNQMGRIIFTISAILISLSLNASIVYRHNAGGGCISRVNVSTSLAAYDQEELLSVLDSDCGAIEIKCSSDSKYEIIVTAEFASDSMKLEYVVSDLNGNAEMNGIIKEGVTTISTEELPSGVHVIAVGGYESVEYLKFNKY